MSRWTFFDEKGEEKEVIYRMDECRYKVNGKCYNNFTAGYKRLGKKCWETGTKEYCTHFLCEEKINGKNDK